MTTIQEPQFACKAQSVPDEYRRWVFFRMPHVGSLLDILDAGGSPNFLDVLSAISEMVAFYTEGDPQSEEPPGKNILMSVKNCRFCY